MKIICSQCKKDLGEKEPLADKRITHTYCEQCSRALLAELEGELEFRKNVGPGG